MYQNKYNSVAIIIFDQMVFILFIFNFMYNKMVITIKIDIQLTIYK